MPRRHRRKTMKGGFWPFDGNTTSSSYGSSNSGMFSNLFGDSSKRSSYGTSNSSSGFFGNLFGSTSSTNNNTSYTNAPMSTSTYGGKHSRRRRHMRGGFKDNTPTTGVASHAAPISGVSTAKAHNWVGGRTRRRGRKTSRHRKY
jgi:hypothetical protein